jgi:hypothetical protein
VWSKLILTDPCLSGAEWPGKPRHQLYLPHDGQLLPRLVSPHPSVREVIKSHAAPYEASNDHSMEQANINRLSSSFQDRGLLSTERTTIMHLHTAFIAALSTALVGSLALPSQHEIRDSVRITSQTPALNSASDGSVVDKRQDTPLEGTFDRTSDSSETFGSNCSGDCLGAAWKGDAQQAKRGEISHGSVKDDGYNADGSAWDN